MFLYAPPLYFIFSVPGPLLIPSRPTTPSIGVGEFMKLLFPETLPAIEFFDDISTPSFLSSTLLYSQTLPSAFLVLQNLP